MSKAKSSTIYYLRDRWDLPGGIVKWARREGYEFTHKRTALLEAKKLARSIGKGAEVQVVSVTTTIAAEVTS